ncbi:MAG: family 16 glycosylhydrolase [Marinoscillum sp.]
MRSLLIFPIILILLGCGPNIKKISFAENPVIAHRGAWKANGHPHNSIASLRQAIDLNCTGSEFDVRMTADEVLIVTHGADYNGLPVETSTFEQLSAFKLENGEMLPTLEQYLRAGMSNNDSTGLVCEIKPSKFKERNPVIAKKVVDLVKKLKADDHILAYISFSYKILRTIKELAPQATTQYLDGSIAPDRIKSDDISGVDYYIDKLKKRHHWVQSAQELGLQLNAWTVNDPDDVDWVLANDFDFITTDEPELVLERMKSSPTAKGWDLIWSDEFEYSGSPDSTKWTFDYGFLSNREEQYFTDRLENARVEDGKLILEAHKEKIVNKDYQSDAFENKSWLQYITEIDTAQYTSARINTRGLTSWKYGRIEVKARLPKGVGLWPAIWMLGDNRDEVGWPECGEIDIMEHVGFDPDSIFGTIHTKAFNHMKGTERGKKIYIDQPYESSHVFAIEWTPEKMDFLLDETVYNQIINPNQTTAEWPFDQPFYLIMNVSVGGMLGGRKGVDDSIFPQRMEVDYVRVYQ